MYVIFKIPFPPATAATEIFTFFLSPPSSLSVGHFPSDDNLNSLFSHCAFSSSHTLPYVRPLLAQTGFRIRAHALKQGCRHLTIDPSRTFLREPYNSVPVIGSTHQQQPIDEWHCWCWQVPSLLHLGMYSPGKFLAFETLISQSVCAFKKNWEKNNQNPGVFSLPQQIKKLLDRLDKYFTELNNLFLSNITIPKFNSKIVR